MFEWYSTTMPTRVRIRRTHRCRGYSTAARRTGWLRIGFTLGFAMHAGARIGAAQAAPADASLAELHGVVTASRQACADTLDVLAAVREAPAGVGRCEGADTVTRRRRKAVTLSDAYEFRLAIHKIASYATVPLFTAQAIVGQQLFVAEQAGNRPSSGLRDTHDVLAVGVATLFGINTITGSMNWWETRSDTIGRTWRTVHASLMLASDAGFAYAAFLGTNARHLEASRVSHKNWAIGSATVALVSYVMMLSPFRRD
jgi:hypothetical protein